MEINLKNKTAWVFGGSKGIGRAIAIQLSKSGANILLISRNKFVKMGKDLFLSIKRVLTQSHWMLLLEKILLPSDVPRDVIWNVLPWPAVDQHVIPLMI